MNLKDAMQEINLRLKKEQEKLSTGVNTKTYKRILDRINRLLQCRITVESLEKELTMIDNEIENGNKVYISISQGAINNSYINMSKLVAKDLVPVDTNLKVKVKFELDDGSNSIISSISGKTKYLKSRSLAKTIYEKYSLSEGDYLKISVESDDSVLIEVMDPEDKYTCNEENGIETLDVVPENE